MDIVLMDKIADTQREYVKVKEKAEKSQDPKLKKEADALLKRLRGLLKKDTAF